MVVQYTPKTEIMYEFAVDIVTFPIVFFTMSYTFFYAVKNKLILFYSRFLLALAIMTYAHCETMVF